MNNQLKINNLSKEFSLKYNKRLFTNIICKRENIIIDDYLQGCPHPPYSKYNSNPSNIKKNFLKFTKSEGFTKEMKSPQGAKTGKDNIKWKLAVIKKSGLNKGLKKRLYAFYKKISALDKGYGVSIVDKECSKDKEVILHEFIHILLESNNIRLGSWKWNEGLVTYLTSYSLKKEKIHQKRPLKSEFHSVTHTYQLYAHKWSNLLNNSRNPKERLRIIRSKL